MVINAVRSVHSEATAAWVRHRARWLAPSVTLLGAGLRLYHLGTNGFNLDEIWSIWMAQQSVLDIVRTILVQHTDATPPLYYVLLHGFLLLGQQPFVVRMLSLITGTLLVWLTFHLAAYLMDLRVATLSALLMAIAPLAIEYSQIARAYMLANVWAILSLYFFARLLFGSWWTRPQDERPQGPMRPEQAEKWHWLGLLAASAAALYSHYLIFVLIVFENALVVFLWLRRRLARPMLTRWLASQAVLGIIILPVASPALLHVAPGAGQFWLGHPGLASLVKTAIFFTSGDPSYGPIGVTGARVLSLATFLGICVLGFWTLVQRGYHRAPDEEGRRVLFLVSAVIVPWTIAFVVSQVRPVYHQKYLIFLMPPLFIGYAWVFTRARSPVARALLLLMLLGLTGKALCVYYTEPGGEQWREAMAYLRPTYEPDDVVVIAPGFYGRLFAYYLYGDFPENIQALSPALAIVVEHGHFRPVNLYRQAEEVRTDDPALASARHIWFLTGEAPPDPTVAAWVEQQFEPRDTGEFPGVRVRRLERRPDSTE